MTRFPTLREAYQHVRPACVGLALRQGESAGAKFFCFGSGVCVDPSGIVVTAGHVINGYYKFTGRKPGDRTPPDFSILFTSRGAKGYNMAVAQPRVVWVADDVDVACIKISYLQQGWPFLRPEVLDVAEGDAVAAAGYPLRSFDLAHALPDLFSGIVSSLRAAHDPQSGWDVKDLVLDISVHPGNSGGPVFTEGTGQLIGIVSSQRLRSVDKADGIAGVLAQAAADNPPAPDTQVWTNITHCVPLTTIIRAIDTFRAQLVDLGVKD